MSPRFRNRGFTKKISETITSNEIKSWNYEDEALNEIQSPL